MRFMVIYKSEEDTVMESTKKGHIELSFVFQSRFVRV